MKQRNKIYPSAFLYLKKDWKILLWLRKNTWYEDWNFYFVAWYIEAWETPLEWIIREAKEEANIDLKREDLELVHVMSRILPEHNERISFFFRANNYSWEIKNLEPEKCSELSWFPLDKLPENTTDFIVKAIHNIENNIIYDEVVVK